MFAASVGLASAEGSVLDAWLSYDGLSVYVSPTVVDLPPPRQVVAVARRSDTAEDFSPFAIIEALDVDKVNADPTVTPDERVIVFDAYAGPPDDRDLWYAVANAAGGGYGTPALLPTVNTSDNQREIGAFPAAQLVTR